MYFNVQQSGNTLVVNSDTYWSCNAYGSIRLSQYSGSGDTTITIELPDDMSFGFGRVVFSYGDGRCDYPSLNVYLTNECWIKTIPMYKTRKEGDETIHEINIPYTEDGEAINVKVFSNTPWYVEGLNVYVNDNDILIPANESQYTIRLLKCKDKVINIILCRKNGVT